MFILGFFTVVDEDAAARKATYIMPRSTRLNFSPIIFHPKFPSSKSVLSKRQN